MEKAKILVCDDELIVAEDLRHCLEVADHEVTGVAGTGNEAIRLAIDTKPDLALMDINLSGEPNGLEVAQILKDSLGIPVLFVTAYADNDTLQRAKKVEPIGFIVKPFQESDLKTALEIGLYRFHKQREVVAEKSESIRTLAAGVAHNINNSMCVVQGSIEYLRRTKTMTALERSVSGMALDECQRAASIVTKLLHFSDRQTDEPAETTLDNFISELVHECELQLKSKVTVDIVKSDEHYAVKVSPRLFTQAFKSIVINADESMEAGQEISVRLFREFKASPKRGEPGWFVCVQVSDCGRGIEASDLGRVCEPFFTTKDETLGEGLGLSVAYGVLQAHAGWLDIESTIGAGTSVRMYFPVVNELTELSASDAFPLRRAR